MNIVQLESKSIHDLREQRKLLIQGMIEDQEGSLLIIRSAFAGKDRKHHLISFAVFTIFFELWDRFTMETWSYTFDKEGLIFYMKLEENGSEVKDALVHYEDYHPLGFAVDGDVFDKDKNFTREDVGAKERIDKYLNKPFDKLVTKKVDNSKYSKEFLKDIEVFMLKGDKQTILSNITVYSYVSAFTKTLGFGIYGPNYRGSNEQMNFEKFIHFLKTYQEETLDIFEYNSNDPRSILKFQRELNQKIKQVLLNQDSFYFTIFMTSMVLFSFINSRGFADINKQIQSIFQELKDITEYNGEDKERYEIASTGFKEVFKNYIPFLQKHDSVISTLLYIMSRHDDYSILNFNGDKNLKKVQFLSKNLMFKEEKWIELDKFCRTNYLYPHDATTLLVVTLMLDVLKRNYLKIKILFDTNH